jgi:RNA recognition motif-containing protein
MFVGGLSWETTEEGLRSYMEKFGVVEDCLVMKEPGTGRSRGFAFLTFKNPESMEELLKSDHYIDGKKIDPKRAVPKDEYERAEKIFIGGLPNDLKDDELLDFFKAFGDVSDATIMNDRVTGKSRGFGFVTFTDMESVHKVLDAQSRRGIFIRGKRVLF